MDLKCQILFFIFFLNFIQSSKRTCNPELLRSMGFHGRITPSRGNGLCPKIVYNCCTMHDQMLMHKQYNGFIKHALLNKAKESVSAFAKVDIFFSQKKTLDLIKINKDYLRLVNIKPPVSIEKHLKKLAKIFQKKPYSFYKPLLNALSKSRLPSFYRMVGRLREGTLCALCNFHSKSYFDLTEKIVTYENKFCLESIVKKHIDLLNDKYVEVIHQMIVFDEWVSIIANRHLFTDSSELNILKRLVLIVQNCKKTPNMKGCEALCSEFNTNKFTYIFNGESKPIELFLRNFNVFLQILKKNPSDLFNKLPINWSDDKTTNKFHDDSVLSKTMGIKEEKKIPASQRLKFKMSIPKVIGFIEKEHPTNSIQVETLEDEVDSYTLYKIKEKPVDLSSFKIVYSLHGFNPHIDGEKNNFRETKQKLLAMLNNSGNDPNKMSEIIEPEIKIAVNSIKEKDLVEYFSDKKLSFKKMISQGAIKRMMIKIAKMKKNARVLKQDAPTNGSTFSLVISLIMGLLFL